MNTSFQITGSFQGADAIISKYKQIEESVKAITNALKDQVGVSGRLGRESNDSSGRRTRQLKEEEAGILKVAHQYEKYYRGIQQVKGVWSEQFEGFHKYNEAAQTLERAEARFETLNLGAHATAQGLKAVDDVVKQGRNSYSDMTNEIISLHSALGNLEEATQFLDLASKTEYVFSSLFGLSPEQTRRDVKLTTQALEQMGALKMTGPPDASGHASFSDKDKERFMKYYDTVFKMKMLTGGQISGSEIQQFVARSGVAGMQLSPEGLQNMTYLISELGGAGAGVGLASMFQSWRALRQGAGGQRSFENMAALGLVDIEKAKREKLVDFTKEGRIKKLKPGAIPIADLLSEDPMQFAAAIQEALEKNGKKVFGKNFDPKNVSSVALALSQITGSRTAMNELAKMIIQSPQIHKDARNVERSMGLDEATKLLDEKGVGQLKRWEVAIENFEQKAGQPLLHTLAGLGTAGVPFLNFLEKHPTMAMAGMSTLKLTTGMMEMIAVYRQIKMAGLVSNALNAGTSGSAIAQTGANAAAASTQVGLYRRQLTNIPSVIGTTIALSAATGLLAYLLKLKDEAEAAWADAKGAAQQGKTATDRLYGTKNVSDETIKMMGYHGMAGQLSEFLKGDVETPFHPKELVGSGFWEKYILGHQGRSDEMVRRMREQMPELAMPSQFAFFVDSLKKNKNLTSEQRQQLMNSAITAQPKAYEKYDAALKAANGDQIAAINALVEQDRAQATAAQTAAEQINKLSGSAEKLSGKFENFHFPGETNDDGTSKNGPGFFHNNSSHRNLGNDGPTLTKVLGRVTDALKSSGSAGHTKATVKASGPTHLTIQAPVTAYGEVNEAKIEAAVKRGIMSAKNELLKVLYIAYKDREPVA
jgi:hypothetical protein